MSTSVIEGPVEIGMSLDIASIDAISEINMVHSSFCNFSCVSVWLHVRLKKFSFTSTFQDYTATIFLRQRWRDSRLVFPGNESISVDGRLVSLLWIPDTFIPDSKRSFLHDVTVENRLIRIFSNGTVLYALRYVFLLLFLKKFSIFPTFPGQWGSKISHNTPVLWGEWLHFSPMKLNGSSEWTGFKCFVVVVCVRIQSLKNQAIGLRLTNTWVLLYRCGCIDWTLKPRHFILSLYELINLGSEKMRECHSKSR